MATKTKVPSRNQLAVMQSHIDMAFGDFDEYHFYATGRSTKYDRHELTDRKRVVKDIEREIRQLEQSTAKYLAALRVLRDKITTTKEQTMVSPHDQCESCSDRHSVILIHQKGTSDEQRDKYCRTCADEKLTRFPEWWTVVTS